MSTRVYSLQLQVNVGDEAHEAMLSILQTFAQAMLANAALLSVVRNPSLRLLYTNSLMDTEEMPIEPAADNLGG